MTMFSVSIMLSRPVQAMTGRKNSARKTVRPHTCVLRTTAIKRENTSTIGAVVTSD